VATHQVDESSRDEDLKDEAEDAQTAQTSEYAAGQGAAETDTQGGPEPDSVGSRHDEPTLAADDQAQDDEADDVTDEVHNNSPSVLLKFRQSPSAIMKSDGCSLVIPCSAGPLFPLCMTVF
jgi:hypothetical protein